MQVCFIARSRVISGVEGALRRAGGIRRIALVVHTFIGGPHTSQASSILCYKSIKDLLI